MYTHATTRAALLLGAAFLAGCAGLRSVPAETPEERAALATELVAGMRISVVTASGAIWEGELEEASEEGVRVWARRFSEGVFALKEFRFQSGEGDKTTDPARTILKLEAWPASNAMRLFEPLAIETEAQQADLEPEFDEPNQLVKLTTADGKSRIVRVVSMISDSPGGIHGSYYSDSVDQYLYQDFYFAGDPMKAPEVTITSLARVRNLPRTTDRVEWSDADSSGVDVGLKVLQGVLFVVMLPFMLLLVLLKGF